MSRSAKLADETHTMHNRCTMQQMAVAAPGEDQLVDAVLSASRVLVAIAARSLADVGEEVTLTQYRSLVVLASRGPRPRGRPCRRSRGDAADRIEDVRPLGEEGSCDAPGRST